MFLYRRAQLKVIPIKNGIRVFFGWGRGPAGRVVILDNLMLKFKQRINRQEWPGYFEKTD